MNAAGRCRRARHRGDRDGDRDGRRGRADPRRRAGRVRADRRRRHVETLTPGARAPAGPGRGWSRPTWRSWPSTSARGSSPGCGSASPRPRAWRSRSASASSGRPASTSSRRGRRAAGHRGLVLACVDARRGEVFAAVRELDAGGVVVAEPVAPGLFAPADLVAALGGSGRRTGAGRGRRRRGATPACSRPCPASRSGARPVLPAPGGAARPGAGAPRGGRSAGRAGARRSPVHARGGRNGATSPGRSGPEAVPS